MDIRIAKTRIRIRGGAAGDAEDGESSRECSHVSILTPDGVLLIPVVVHLDVYIIAVEQRDARCKVVAQGTWKVRVGKVRLELLSNRANSIRRNFVSGKRRSSHAIRATRCRVIDQS